MVESRNTVPPTGDIPSKRRTGAECGAHPSLAVVGLHRASYRSLRSAPIIRPARNNEGTGYNLQRLVTNS